MSKSVLNEESNILHFQQNGYCVIKQAVAANVIELFNNYALMQRYNKYYLKDEVTKSDWVYADALGESLLLQLQPLMEKYSNCKLYPTNSVLRIYKNGGILKKHIDRPTCEFSATLTIGYDAKELYPIWVKSAENKIPIHLDCGDMLLYKGCEIPHWRDEFSGRYWIQLFLHYVDANGEFAKYKNDGRLMIGMNNGNILKENQIK